MSGSFDHTPPSLRRSVATLDARIDLLAKRGVIVIDPRQLYLDDAVEPERIAAGAVLWPGTRLIGAQTMVGPGCEVGVEGPTTLRNSVLEREVRVASGYVEGSLCLQGAKVGANAHIRPGCILEESVSTAHCVGLKQTILLSFVTLGSLINFCDCLMAGGISEKQHAEVGSGYIHFNFTPWGERGDKATPSLIGDVVRGVFLDQPKIFLGGMGGMVGPRSVGFGSVAAAGQVLRKDLPEGRLMLNASVDLDRPWKDGALDRCGPRAQANLRYLSQLCALQCWYEQVRLPRAKGRGDRFAQLAASYGLSLLEGAVKERLKQLNRFLQERGEAALSLEAWRAPTPSAAWQEARGHASSESHVQWVRKLNEQQRQDLGRDLQETAAAFMEYAAS